MNYDKFITDPMPKYSKGEEIFNFVTHLIGAVIATLILIYVIIKGFKNEISFKEYFSASIFAVSAIIVYLVSTLYHALHPTFITKRLLRIIDHCDIYLLIAGTYMPVCLIALNGTIWCYIILSLEWLMAIGGIIMNAIDLNNKAIKIISMIFYIVGGWIVVFFPPAIKYINKDVFLFILFGGISYTVGSILYGIGSKRKWFHSIFHLFCLLGTILQGIGIILLINK